MPDIHTGGHSTTDLYGQAHDRHTPEHMLSRSIAIRGICQSGICDLSICTQKQSAASPDDDCERSAEQSDGADEIIFAYVKWRRRDDRHRFRVKHSLSQIPSDSHTLLPMSRISFLFEILSQLFCGICINGKYHIYRINIYFNVRIIIQGDGRYLPHFFSITVFSKMNRICFK